MSGKFGSPILSVRETHMPSLVEPYLKPSPLCQTSSIRHPLLPSKVVTSLWMAPKTKLTITEFLLIAKTDLRAVVDLGTNSGVLVQCQFGTNAEAEKWKKNKIRKNLQKLGLPNPWFYIIGLCNNKITISKVLHQQYYTKMFKTDSFIDIKKLSLTQNVWRQQDVLLFLGWYFYRKIKLKYEKKYSVVQL